MSNTNLAPLLREHPFLRGFAREHIDFMVGCTSNVRFKEGDFLIHEGDPADHSLLIRDGTISLEIYVPGPGVQRVETLGAGDVLGYSWLFPPSRMNLDARALSDVRALRFDGECLRKKMEADPAFGYQMAMRFLNRLTHRIDRVHLQQLDAYRVAAQAHEPR